MIRLGSSGLFYFEDKSYSISSAYKKIIFGLLSMSKNCYSAIVDNYQQGPDITISESHYHYKDKEIKLEIF